MTAASLITPDTSVLAALRLRPLLAENLAALGAALWETPRARLADVFGHGESLGRFLERAAVLPIPATGSPWRELPATHLVDHLTHHHRDFFHVTLPDVAGVFRDWNCADPEVARVREDFEDFARGLRDEVEAEEAYLFPRVLRYDACLRDPAVDPEFNGGSLRHAPAYRQSHFADVDPARLDAMVERLRETRPVREGHTWAEMALIRLGDFASEFRDHERLEAEVLYPMALEMEMTLYDLSIAGTGPMAVSAG